MLQELTRELEASRDLPQKSAARALELILAEGTPDREIMAFLSALYSKGETPSEIAGFARIMRRHAVSLRCRHRRFIDTAGTGGGADTFNVSTAAAFVIAGAGLPVAKHATGQPLPGAAAQTSSRLWESRSPARPRSPGRAWTNWGSPFSSRRCSIPP